MDEHHYRYLEGRKEGRMKEGRNEHHYEIFKKKNEGRNEHHYEIFRRKEGRMKEGMKGW